MAFFAQVVTIPDANFKAYLLANASINTNMDTEIQVSEATAFTGHINCPGMNISSLLGIEAFVNLTQLSCYNNNLSVLNLEQNTALTFLRAELNQLTSLLLNRTNSLLWYVNVTSNLLTSFNAWEHPLLEVLFVRFNQLSTINLNQNNLLRVFGCGSNLFSNLDVSQNPALEYLYFSHNQIASINLSQNPVLFYIDCVDNQLTSLDFSQNPLLNEVLCWDNLLTSINVTQNANLEKLNCHGNQLATLDVSQNTALLELFCETNPLTNLDLTQNTSLVKLGCYSSQLTSLNVQNGNNVNFTYYNSQYNPNLICIFVDDANYSIANWPGVDPASTFVNNIAGCNALSTEKNDAALEFSIYPNPTTTYLNIHCQETLDYIEVYNVLGETVWQTKSLVLSTEALTKGVYFIKLSANNKQSVKRFIKQ